VGVRLPIPSVALQLDLGQAVRNLGDIPSRPIIDATYSALNSHAHRGVSRNVILRPQWTCVSLHRGGGVVDPQGPGVQPLAMGISWAGTEQRLGLLFGPSAYSVFITWRWVPPLYVYSQIETALAVRTLAYKSGVC